MEAETYFVSIRSGHKLQDNRFTSGIRTIRGHYKSLQPSSCSWKTSLGEKPFGSFHARLCSGHCLDTCSTNLRPSVFKVWSAATDDRESLKLFQGLRIIFVILRHYLPFSTVLTFALLVQKQWWVKLLGPQRESRKRHQTVLAVILFFTATHPEDQTFDFI